MCSEALETLVPNVLAGFRPWGCSRIITLSLYFCEDGESYPSKESDLLFMILSNGTAGCSPRSDPVSVP